MALTDRALDADALADTATLRAGLLHSGFHRKLVDTVAYWHSLHLRGRPPYRADIDPAAMRALLPCVALLDDAGPEGAARWRLAGTAVVDLLGCEPTGRPLTAIASPVREFLLDCWQRQAAAGDTLGRVARLRDSDAAPGGVYQYECAYLPLSCADTAEAPRVRVLLCLLRRFLSDAQASESEGPHSLPTGFAPVPPASPSRD
jgi:hypothetical protein